MKYGVYIEIGLLAAAFAIAWWLGYLTRLANYVAETREEMRKCTWPTWAELKGSTVVVMISIAILGVFTMVVDWVFFHIMRLLT